MGVAGTRRAAARGGPARGSMSELRDLFEFTMQPWELVLRGSLVFWFLFLVFRFVLRRDVGSMGVTDFLFVVLLGDAAQNGMIGDASSPTDALLLITTLVGWNVALDFATSRSPALERLFASSKLCLVRDGRMCRRNMRREFISVEELMSKVREYGLDDLSAVKTMYLEADGEISLVKQEDDGAGRAPGRRARRP
jgi:uncharacterized membrane protein YcaP (DUF421 family)